MSVTDITQARTGLRRRYASEGEGRLVDDIEECARRCLAAAGACWQCLSARLENEDPLPEPLSALIDCAELCELTARCLMRGSSGIRVMAAACAEMCERTVTVAGTDEDLRPCVEAARRCARACRSLAEAA